MPYMDLIDDLALIFSGLENYWMGIAKCGQTDITPIFFLQRQFVVKKHMRGFSPF